MVERVLLIGQAPSAATNPDLPLYPHNRSCAGGRLVEFFGITKGEYLNSYDRCNLLPFYPGKSGRGDRFPMREARLCASAVSPFLSGRVVIFVGRSVATAFGYDKRVIDFFTWRERTRRGSPFTFGLIPHPSGLNRVFNSTESRVRAKRFHAEAMQKISSGGVYF